MEVNNRSDKKKTRKTFKGQSTQKTKEEDEVYENEDYEQVLNASSLQNVKAIRNWKTNG